MPIRRLLKGLAVFTFLWVSISAQGNQKLEYWNTQRKGANFFNDVETKQRFLEAKTAGIEVVRLVFNKWQSAIPSGIQGDFLLGPKGKFKGLVEEDPKKLLQALDWAEEAGIKVVITNLSLPGLRWIQQNQGVRDNRLWQDFKYHRQAAEFWQLLAKQLKHHPAVVGYNLLNEPQPEFANPVFKDWFTGDYSAWYQSVKDSPQDLNLFHATVARSIRSVDDKTPIIVDSGFYSTPWAFKVLDPLPVKHVLYSFHMYEPYSFTSFRNRDEFENQKFFYPGAATIGESEPPPVLEWNKQALFIFLEPVRKWQQKHHISSKRVFVSEFGVFRSNQGADRYLKDLIAILQQHGWHWAFYSYREDSWAGMDYELGQKKLSAGLKYPLQQRQKQYQTNPLFEALKDALFAPPRP